MPERCVRRVAALLALAAAGAAPAPGPSHAAPPATTPSTAPDVGHPRGDWDKGAWTFHTYGGYVNDLGPYDVEGGFAAAGFNYYLVDGISLGGEVAGYGISQPVHNAVAVAPGIVFRHHLVDTGNSSFFVDVAGAMFFANERVPDEGTDFNFATQAGIGLTQKLGGGSHLLLGVRFFHLSNANLEGDDRNPSLNGISAYVGLMFRL